MIHCIASRESHAAQRALQSQRKLAKPNSALIADAKRVWALARQKNIPKNERQKHVADLMDVIKGKVQDVVFKHDASRVVQTVCATAAAATRRELTSKGIVIGRKIWWTERERSSRSRTQREVQGSCPEQVCEGETSYGYVSSILQLIL